MNRYTATFTDHTITRRSDREYSHAWIVTINGKIVYKGFSGSAELARKAAAATAPRHISDRDKRISRRTHKLLAKDKGVSVERWYADRKAETDATIAARTIEIVAVERA
tara:strand:- start:605 stop:931 length:327 start_codon:yes stop_codon:yes gene_type:complete